MNWESRNLNIVFNSCETYRVRGQGMVFRGFQWFSGWWHCSSSWSSFGSSHPEDVPGRKELTWSSSLQTVWFPTCRSCRTWMNGKLVVLAVTNASPSTSPTCSRRLRWIDHRSHDLHPWRHEVSQIFEFANLHQWHQWHQWQSKCLDTSKGHFRTLSLCMSDRCSHLLDFQWHQYVSWRSFACRNITMSLYA